VTVPNQQNQGFMNNPGIVLTSAGVVIVDPDKETRLKYEQFAKQQIEFIHSLDALQQLPAVTKDGHEITLLGNVEFPEEVFTVIEKQWISRDPTVKHDRF